MKNLLKLKPNFILFVFILLIGAFTSTDGAIIKPGMYLNIVVKNDKELSQIVRVNDNGTIEYPLYQDMSITGKTTSELQDLLTYKLAKMVESPLVLVSVISENPINIYVLGQVKKPGLVTVVPKASLQEVLMNALGPTEQADLGRVKVVHRNQGDESANYFDLQRFLSNGDLSLLPNLEDGDRVIVLSSKKSKYIKVLGAVNKPGFYPLTESASVFDMLYFAGGPTPEANLSKVRIMTAPGGQKSDFLIDMQKFVDEGKTDNLPLLSEGDVVIVYAKTFTWEKGLTVVRDLVALVTAWFVISQLAK
jgi:protein involved in polysaccharide export with SLBB domain